MAEETKVKGVDVIIPTCKPGHQLELILKKLEQQTYQVSRVIIMNTEKAYYDESRYEFSGGLKVVHITSEEFDHGKTRHEGILLSDADYCLLMTQDAVPYDEYLVEKLVEAFEEDGVAVAYGRQLPAYDCRMIEQLSRGFNYPAESRIKTVEDIKTMGIKAFFCSDVCAMYDRRVYLEAGGFIRRTIFNEDMIMAHKLLTMGYKVYYKADAQVIHSHNYTNMQQLHRNFDLGVSQTDNPQTFSGISSESEGVKFLLRLSKLLIKGGRIYDIPYLYINSAFRLLGYKLGRNYKRLPMWLVRKCSMNRNYWRK